MAEDKKQWEVDPVFKEIKFGIGDMYTRKGRGLIEDDLPSDLGSAKPGKFGAHSKGGRVKHGSSTVVACKGKFS